MSWRAVETPDEDPIGVPGPWRHRTVSANGTRFHLVELGDGPLILLLHGFPEFWWAWRQQLTGFANAGYRVAAVDLRGYGGSDKPPRGYDLATLAGDATGLVRTLGEAGAVVVGHGIGALGAWTTAALHPKVVRRLVAVSAPHPLRLHGPRMVRSNLRGLGHGLAFQLPRRPERQLVAADGRFVREFLTSWSRPGWPEAGVAERYAAAIGVPHAAHCALEYYRWLGRSPLRPDGLRFARWLHAAPIRVPALLLHGAQDALIAPASAAESAQHVEAPYQWRLLEAAGHFPHEEAPEAFNHAVLTWLADPEPER